MIKMNQHLYLTLSIFILLYSLLSANIIYANSNCSKVFDSSSLFGSSPSEKKASPYNKTNQDPLISKNTLKDGTNNFFAYLKELLSEDQLLIFTQELEQERIVNPFSETDTLTSVEAYVQRSEIQKYINQARFNQENLLALVKQELKRKRTHFHKTRRNS